MRIVLFVFVLMIASASGPATSLVAQASPAPQEVPSQGSGKSANQQKDVIRSDKDQGHPKEVDENQEPSADVPRTKNKRRPSVSHSKPVAGHQAGRAKTPTMSNPRNATPGKIAALAQTGSNPATVVPNKAASHRGMSAPPSAVSVNGQRFKNSRDPGARLAVSGGPLTSPGGTAAINGTTMRHKP